MLPLLYGPSLIRKMFCFWPRLHVLPDILPIENVRYIATERLVRHHMLVTTIDELRQRVEAAWISVHVHVIQSLFHSMKRRVWSVITVISGSSAYLFLRIFTSKVLEDLITCYFCITYLSPMKIIVLFVFLPGVVVLMARQLPFSCFLQRLPS
ncbi:hypothetical protein TNCV_256051 [Trichonephila clavipes]|nr:hypothetical protein TNCV_256051 [Trichonephila clavipes]